MPLPGNASYRRGLPAFVAITAVPMLAGGLQIAHAGGLGLKPGLWEVRLVRQIVDGNDVSAQLTESVAKAQTALSKLSPEARARAEERFHPGHDAGGNSSFRICLTPAMAASDLPVLDKDGRCRPAMLSQRGRQVNFRIQCRADGTLVKGQGRAVRTGGLIAATSDVVTRAADGSTHTLHNESQMQYLSADCGKLPPPVTTATVPGKP